MKCSLLSILAFAVILPACDFGSHLSAPDGSTGVDDWGTGDIAIPLEETEGEETDHTVESIDPTEEQELESGSLPQDESSASETSSETGEDEESTDAGSETDEGEDSTSDTSDETGESEESTSDTGDETGDDEESTGGKPWDIARACYAECKAHEDLDPIRAEQDAYNEMPRGGDSNELTCARNVVELRVRALFQQAAIDCRDECALWRWTDIDREIAVCTHEEVVFLNACYAKYECKWPRQPGHMYDDSRCESVGRTVWNYCMDGWDPPEDTSAIPD